MDDPPPIVILVLFTIGQIAAWTCTMPLYFGTKTEHYEDIMGIGDSTMAQFVHDVLAFASMSAFIAACSLVLMAM